MDISTLLAAIWTELGGMAGLIALIVLVAERIAKIIPDEATGVLGVIRKIAKLIGAYTVTRKTKDDPLG